MTNAPTGHAVLSAILRNDAKLTSYKMALVRAINDVVLAFPDVASRDLPVAVPLRVLAEFWAAYYWPFADTERPIYQGPRAFRDGRLRQDVIFRSELAVLRQEWESYLGTPSRPADGFFLAGELRTPRRRATLPAPLLKAYYSALTTISRAIEMPIRYAGLGEWTVFDRPAKLAELGAVVALPDSRPHDVCLVISAGLWETFRDMSLWVEALCIQQWCLFTETVGQSGSIQLTRGTVYQLLTDRPDNRRPLTWERNNVDVLLLEGKVFVCPWSERTISKPPYALDHLVPVSAYPINELWNLVPSDPHYNSAVKRHRLPTLDRLARAEPHVALAYSNYSASSIMAPALREDVASRFSTVTNDPTRFTLEAAKAAVSFVNRLAEARNLPRF